MPWDPHTHPKETYIEAAGGRREGRPRNDAVDGTAPHDVHCYSVTREERRNPTAAERTVDYRPRRSASRAASVPNPSATNSNWRPELTTGNTRSTSRSVSVPGFCGAGSTPVK